MSHSLQIQRTHKNISEFNLYRPTSVTEVCTYLAKFGEHCILMGGGIDLLQELKSGRQVDNIIYLKTVPELNSIRIINNSVCIGACVTHRSLETDPIVHEHLPAFANVWHNVGNIRVRVTGTIGGNILKRDPNYDGVPALSALDAVAHFKDINGSHSIPVTNLSSNRPSGLLTTIEIPIKKKQVFTMDRTLKPIASVALSACIDKNQINKIRVGIGCAFTTSVGGTISDNLNISSNGLTKKLKELARTFAEDLPEPINNVFGSASYRKRMISVLLYRQLITLAKANK